jgi:hypothetical protein
MKGTQIMFRLTALILVCAAAAFAAETRDPDVGRRPGPPPEAYSACLGKKAGETSKFVDPRGETLTGSCEQEGERLVLRPDRNKGQTGDRHPGPPPEAYAACQGKKAGEISTFVDPRGETRSGACEQEGDRLVLRPDRSKQGRPSSNLKNEQGKE